MIQASSNNELFFLKWQQRKASKSQVWEELQHQGWSAEDISATWKDYAEYRLDKRNTLGWTLMGVGGFLGLISCVLTLLDAVPSMRGVLMYGLTSIAVAIALYGCYLVMESPNDEDA